MFSLVYTSQAAVDFRHQEIQEMVNKARQSNEQNNITGCLLFFKDRFIQYLEGDEKTVKELYDRIKSDRRNTNVTLLSENTIENRQFKTWEMAYEHLRSENSNLQYLKLLVSTFFEDPKNALSPDPTTQEFWNATNLLLSTKYADKTA